MAEINMQSLIVLMKLWENALVQKVVLLKPLVKMKPALAGYENTKPERCTLMGLWEKALVQKLFMQTPV